MAVVGEVWAIVGLISGTIAIVNTTATFYDSFKDVNGQPEEFRSIASKFPLVLEILKAAKEDEAARRLDESVRSEAENNIKACTEKVKALQKIFKAVLRHDDDNWLERYKKAIVGLSKGKRAEELMKEIMRHIKLVTCDRLMGTATTTQIDRLQEAIQEMLDIRSSIPDDDRPIVQNHTGSGHNNNILNKSTNNNSSTGVMQVNQGGGSQEYHVHNHSSSEKYTSLLQSLYFFDMDTRKKSISEPAANTCQWLCDEPNYKDWRVQRQKLLWIIGIPGSGKSTLLKYIYQQDKSRSEPKEATPAPFERGPQKIIVASFFCHSTGDPLQGNRIGLFRSLLHQMLQQIPALPYEVALDFDKRCQLEGEPGNKWEWHERDLETMLENSISYISKEYPEEFVLRIYVDALDEFRSKEPNYSKEPKDLADCFESLMSLDRPGIDLNVCISCRKLPNTVKGSFLVSMEGKNRGDILTYVKTKLSAIRGKGDEAQELIDWIATESSGIFQWAVIAVEKARDLNEDLESPKRILEKLEDMPQALDNLYHKSFLAMDSADRLQSLRLLRWICFAEGSLSVEELHDEMEFNRSITTSRKSADHRSSHQEKENMIKKLSCNLVVITYHEERYIVQLRHQSVHDYLVSKGLQYLKETAPTSGTPPSGATGCVHLQLLMSCINYMASKKEALDRCHGLQALLEGTATNQRQTSNIINEFQDTCPFSSYAATHWAYHANRAENKDSNQKDLLRLYQVLSTTLFIEKFNKVSHRNVYGDGGIALLHIASQQGLLRLVELILHPQENPTATSATSITENGILDKFMAKISKKTSTKVDVNIQTTLGQTPLILAIRGRHESVVELLLKDNSSNADITTKYGETALFFAVKTKQERIVELLLGRAKININRENQFGYTALITAVVLGYGKIVALLLQHRKIDANAGDMFGTTALQFAVRGGDESIIKELLKKRMADIDISAKNLFNQSPLIIAIQNKRWTIVKLLLARKSMMSKDDKKVAEAVEEFTPTELSRMSQAMINIVTQGLEVPWWPKED